MSKAEICPVCEGRGNSVVSEREPPMQKCHGCDGKGWVEVSGLPDMGYPWFPVYPWWPEPQYPRYTWTCTGDPQVGSGADGK